MTVLRHLADSELRALARRLEQHVARLRFDASPVAARTREQAEGDLADVTAELERRRT